MNDYFTENMEAISSSPIYTPQKEKTLNHEAYEYMLNTLTSNNIPVLLLGLPHHPQVYPYLNNQLDNYNYTLANFLIIRELLALHVLGKMASGCLGSKPFGRIR